LLRYYGKMFRSFFRPSSYQRIATFIYVRWPEDGLRNMLPSKIPVSYTIFVLLTEYTNCFIASIETQRDVFN